MATTKKLDSDRRNAPKNPGPDTGDGKASYSRLAQESTLSVEDPHVFQALHDALAAEFEPQGPVEDFLLDTMATSQWRLARLNRIETGYIECALDDSRKSHLLRLLSALPGYEASLYSIWYSALQSLEFRQGDKLQKLKLRNEANSADSSKSQDQATRLANRPKIWEN